MKKSLLDTIMNQIDLSNVIIKHSSTFLTSDPTVKIVPDDLAILIGVDQTMMLCQIDFWIQNHQDDEHCKDGRYWIYESYDNWKEQFPYWGKTKIREIIRKLKEKNLIITGNYNKMSGDNTKWYTVNYDLLDKIMSEKKRLDDTHLSENGTGPLSESDTCHLSENGRPIPNISIPNKSLPKNQKKINGAFQENAQHILDNNHIENINAYIARTKERILQCDDLAPYADELCQAIEHYYYRYWNAKRENHPPYSPSNMRKVCEVFVNYLGNNGILDMIDKYFETESMKENSDLRMLHFISDGITQNRAYETGQLDAIPHREFD